MTSKTSTALITGGTSGIGRATAKKLAQLGIHVIVVGRQAERPSTKFEQRAGKRILFHLTFEMRLAPARSRKEQSSSEMVKSIFWSTMRGYTRSGPLMK